MAHLLREGLVVHMAGGHPLVDVLGDKVIAQHFGGARMAVLPAHTVKQRVAAKVKAADDATVGHGKLDLLLVVFVDFIGVKKAGFAVQVIGKGIVGTGDVFLHGAMGEQKVREQGKQRVKQRADDDEQRVEIGRGVRVVGERGVDGNGKRAKGYGAIARARCAQ